MKEISMLVIYFDN